MEYIKRELEDLIIEASNNYPVIIIYGQRGVGKTTMLKQLASEDRKYISFDNSNVKNLAKTDPELFFETYGYKLIIDEIQKLPSFLKTIEKVIESKNENGLFWIISNKKFDLKTDIKEQNLIKIKKFTLFPFSKNEIKYVFKEEFSPLVEKLRYRKFNDISLSEIYENIFLGGLPKVAIEKADREEYYNSIIDKFIEKDIAIVEKIDKLDEFRLLITHLASISGQEINYDYISKSIGVTPPTVKEWISILEKYGYIYILKPYIESSSKRLVKIPKCYFVDTGLASFLTSWPTALTLMNSSLSKFFLENYIVMEILKGYNNKGKEILLYYYRDIDKNEIDLLMINENIITPILINKSKNPNIYKKSYGILNKFGLSVNKCLIICNTDELFPVNSNVWLCPFDVI